MSNAQLQTSIRTYYKGTIITHMLTIKVGDKYKSPASLGVYLRAPNGTQSGPLTPIKDGEGRYRYLQSTDLSTQTGTWTIRWLGTGINQGVTERQYYIQSSSFT